MTNCKNFHSRYVLRAMEDHCLNGDAYVAEDILYHRCKERREVSPTRPSRLIWPSRSDWGTFIPRALTSI